MLGFSDENLSFPTLLWRLPYHCVALVLLQLDVVVVLETLCLVSRLCSGVDLLELIVWDDESLVALVVSLGLSVELVVNCFILFLSVRGTC